jgi:hypothetical protein
MPSIAYHAAIYLEDSKVAHVSVYKKKAGIRKIKKINVAEVEREDTRVQFDT